MSCMLECRAAASFQNVKVQGIHAFGNSFYDLSHEGKLGKALCGGCWYSHNVEARPASVTQEMNREEFKTQHLFLQSREINFETVQLEVTYKYNNHKQKKRQQLIMFIYLWSHVNKKTKITQWKQRHDELLPLTWMALLIFCLYQIMKKMKYTITVIGARQVVLLENIK